MKTMRILFVFLCVLSAGSAPAAYRVSAGPDWVPIDYRKGIEPGSALDFSVFGLADAPAGEVVEFISICVCVLSGFRFALRKRGERQAQQRQNERKRKRDDLFFHAVTSSSIFAAQRELSSRSAF